VIAVQPDRRWGSWRHLPRRHPPGPKRRGAHRPHPQFSAAGTQPGV